ncbi:nucleoside deaminase [Paenibacillus sp. NPDC056579]|uniref:nucleoside deaminase n=1 Tax=Paenibacillus sp. NPDC056579 TaxID=3345871 RepID=UPI00369AC48B
MSTTDHWIEHVIRMAEDNAVKEEPFAAIVVRGEVIVGTGVNCVHATIDPSAHAELLAIRDACKRLGTIDLSDCELYASGEPCPMCMGAIYWAKPRAVYFACSKEEAAAGAGFTDPLSSFFAEMGRPPEERTLSFHQIHSSRKLEPFKAWAAYRSKV